MKKNIFFLVVMIVSIVQAQDIITKNLGDFNEVKVFDKIEVILRQGSENKAEISGISRRDVDIINKEGVLKIKMSLDNIWDDDNTKVLVYYKKVSKLDVNEGASIVTKGKVTAQVLDVRAQEGGSIIADIEANRLLAKAVTGGQLRIAGSTKEQEVIIQAGGQYRGRDLKTENTLVKITAGGSADISASQYVKANATAGGTIKIYGNPREIDSKKVFGGKIIEVN